MANPTPYDPGYSFSDFQEANPSEPLPAPSLDNELANISQSMTETQAALANVRRSDGALANNVVTSDAIGNTQVQARHLAFGVLGTTPKATTDQATAGTDNAAYMTPSATKSALAYPQIRTPVWMPGRDYALPVGGGTGTAAAINAALASIGAAGGGELVLPPETLVLDGTIDNRFDRTLVTGVGGNPYDHDGGTPTFGTFIVPTFAGTVLKHRTPFSGQTGYAGYKFSGGGFTNIAVYGNNIATRGLEVTSVNSGSYDVYISGIMPGMADAYAVVFQCGTTGTDLLEACDIQDIKLCRLRVRQVDSTDTKNVGCVLFDGSSNANVSVNSLVELELKHWNGNAFHLRSADNNYIRQRSFRLGGSGYAVYCHGNGNPYPVGGSSNVWKYLNCNAPVYGEGTDTAGVTLGAGNLIDGLDTGNGTAFPTAGTGAFWQTRTQDGLLRYPHMTQAVVTDSLARPYPDKKIKATESLRIVNASGGHLVLEDSDGGEWLVNIGASGKLRFLPGTATQDMQIAARILEIDGAALISGSVGFYGTSPIAQQSLTGALSAVSDANAKAVLTSLVQKLAQIGLFSDTTT